MEKKEFIDFKLNPLNSFTPYLFHITIMESIIDRICEVDKEITRLMIQRNLLVQKAVELKELCKRGRILSDLLVKAESFQNQDESMCYIIRYILPMRDLLPIQHFPAAVVALELPRDWDWSHVSASEFLLAASTALEQDRVAFAEFFI